MKHRKLKYRFVNPNSVEATAEFLCKLLVESNAEKVEKAIQAAALATTGTDDCKEKTDLQETEQEQQLKLKRRRAG